MTTYIFRWDRHGRKGQRCVILARGTMNSCLVKFEDGYMMVTSRNAPGINVPSDGGDRDRFRRARFRKMRHHDSPQRTAGPSAARTVDDGLTPLFG